MIKSLKLPIQYIAKEGIAFSKMISICNLLARMTRNRFYLYAYLSLNHASKDQNLQPI